MPATVRCHQCPTPSFYAVEKGGVDFPLCLSCYVKLANVHAFQALQNMAMINHSEDQMDAIIGIGPKTPRIPVEALARAMTKTSTFNNISIQNSIVGAVNTGNYARINAVIEISKDNERAEFAASLKDLIETIANHQPLDEQRRADLVEITRLIADQASSQKPNKVVSAGLFQQLVTMSSGLTTITAAAERLHATWHLIVGA